MLIFVQLALQSALLKTGHLVYEGLKFDVAILSKEYIYLAQPGGFPRSRLFQASGVEGVEKAAPVYFGVAPWRNPESGSRRLILVIGFDPRQSTFSTQDIQSGLPYLMRPDTVLLDRQTRSEFGPQQPGLRTELGPRRVEVVGLYDMGTGFAAYGGVVSADFNFPLLFPNRSLETVSVGLVSLTDKAAPEPVLALLRSTLPEDVIVLRRDELFAREEEYWDSASSVGIMLAWSVLVDVLVAAAVLYQVLSTDILRRLPEYSTLLALGYGKAFLYRSVGAQALILVSAAFVPALFAAVGICRLGRESAHLPMEVTLHTGVLVGSITLGFAAFSGVLALQKLSAADPADLF